MTTSPAPAQPEAVLEIVGLDSDIRELAISCKSSIKEVKLEVTDKGKRSQQLAHVGSIYGFTYRGDGGKEDRIFRLSKAYILQALEGMDAVAATEEAGLDNLASIDYIAGVLAYLERLRDNGGVSGSSDMLLVVDNVFRYLSNHKMVRRLLALREDALFKLLNENGFKSGFDAGVARLNWADLNCQSKGLSMVYHKSGEAVAYFNGSIVGMRLVDGRYRIARKGLAGRTTHEIEKGFKSLQESAEGMGVMSKKLVETDKEGL